MMRQAAILATGLATLTGCATTIDQGSMVNGNERCIETEHRYVLAPSDEIILGVADISFKLANSVMDETVIENVGSNTIRISSGDKYDETTLVLDNGESFSLKGSDGARLHVGENGVTGVIAEGESEVSLSVARVEAKDSVDVSLGWACLNN